MTAAIGVSRGARWSAIIGGLVGVALVAGGAVLLWIFWYERDLPGSFAALYVPPGVAGVLGGALVLYGVATSPNWFTARR